METGKLYNTRSGSVVRIYALDGGGAHPIHGAWFNALEEEWIPCTWDREGFFIDPEHPRSVDILDGV